MPSFGIFPNDLRYYHDWATQVMKLYLFSRRLSEIRDAKTKLEEQKSETNVKIQEVKYLVGWGGGRGHAGVIGVGKFFLGFISLRGDVVHTPKKVINLLSTYEKLHCKEEPYQFSD